MEGKVHITDYRHRLDNTLTSPHLTNHNLLHTLVKNQILHSSNVKLEECEDMVDRRSNEVFNFLGELRSASEKDSETSKSIDESHGGWKVKQDTEDLRVMYREGLDGTPFHTLLAEGYVDGPVDVCLCVSFQTELYKEWWPQTSIPTFKVDSSRCLKTVRIGEQISLVRVKVSWPLSSREVLIHYFVFEYFQDGLVVVVLNSISDSETLDKSNHGFTRDGLPYAQDVVRIDVSGGFAIQKVTAERSFFRTIATMDIKVDFIPSAFINFLSRQVIGSGFKLYKKVVASVSKGDRIYATALREPLYAHIREALYSESKSAVLTVLKGESLDDIEEIEEKNYHTNQATDEKNIHKEIMQKLKADENKVGFSTAVEIINDSSENFRNEAEKKVAISAEVEQALATLEKVISVYRDYNMKPSKVNSGASTENGYVKESLSSKANKMTSENKNCAFESSEMVSDEPRNGYASRSSRNTGSNSYLRETNQSKIIPAPSSDGILCSSPSRTGNISKYSTISEKIDIRHGNGITEDVMAKRKHKKSAWFGCLSFNSRQ